MKKLLIILIIIAMVILGLQIVIINKVRCSLDTINKCNVDSVVNKVRIDSIELVINKKDSTIINIKERINDEIKEANTLSDSSSLLLFERLVLE